MELVRSVEVIAIVNPRSSRIILETSVHLDVLWGDYLGHLRRENLPIINSGVQNLCTPLSLPPDRRYNVTCCLKLLVFSFELREQRKPSFHRCLWLGILSQQHDK